MGLYVLKYPGRRLLSPLAGALGRVHPDVISYMAVAVALATAGCFVYATAFPRLLLAAIGLILLRMALNTLDGVLAIRRGSLSLKGEIVNALPDRFSDIFLVAGMAFSPPCRPGWGLLALGSMLLVSYAGMLGRALGVSWQHHGPLGKVERLVLVIAFSLAQFLQLRHGWPAWTIFGWATTPLEVCMIVFVALGPVTIFNRTRGMLRQIARLEWPKRMEGDGPLPRVLVAYDSLTGNTRKVARAIAEATRADLRHIDEIDDAAGYDLVVIGSPVMSAKPTDKVLRFASQRRGTVPVAVFLTYGAPIIGPRKVRKALARLAEALGAPPSARFICKGRHALANTYKGHPNDDDLLGAFLFGRRLVREFQRSPR